MITTIRMMITCHFTARRISRYLDADPSAPLTVGEIHRLESHLAQCSRCRTAMGQYRSIDAALERRRLTHGPDERAVTHMRDVLERIVSGEIA